MIAITNPLVRPEPTNTLPAFNEVQAEHLSGAIPALISDNKKLLETLLSKPACEKLTDKQEDWLQLMQPLLDADAALSRCWSPAGHLNAVANSDAWREAIGKCLPMMSAWSTELGQNEQLFDQLKQMQRRKRPKPLDIAQSATLHQWLRDFQLSGVGLEQDKKDRFKAIAEELSTLAQKFDNQVLDATQAWSLNVPVERLRGLPKPAKNAAIENAAAKDLEGALLTLDAPCYMAVMTHCRNRALRREIYEAYATRASDQGPQAKQFDNNPTLLKILELRQEAAQLLGFNNAAEVSVETKMADSPKSVIEFLQELAASAKPAAEAELVELQRFATQTEGVGHLEAWDISYFSERLSEEKFAVSTERLMPYFPFEQTLSGLFDICHQLFDIEVIAEPNDQLWHEHASCWKIVNNQGDIIGRCLVDPFARENKRGGAWMDECRIRMRVNGETQLPVAFLTCNAPPPSAQQPALLTHDDVVTLFHEFGHCLHHLLTEVDVPAVSGINGVAWDAVELPSQFLENWAWETEALQRFAKHWQTGEVLPRSEIEKLKNSRSFHGGLRLVRQIEFALFDMMLHCQAAPKSQDELYDLLNSVREKVAVVKPPHWNRFPNSFSHIFSGGYSAGYYSYLWAEVLSADAFEAFKEQGIFNQALGQQFRKSILARGGSEPAESLYRQFRGRDADPTALLRQWAISAPNTRGTTA